MSHNIPDNCPDERYTMTPARCDWGPDDDNLAGLEILGRCEFHVDGYPNARVVSLACRDDDGALVAVYYCRERNALRMVPFPQ